MNDNTQATEKNAAFTRKITYATYNSRLLAAMIDVLIISVLTYPLVQWISSLFFPPVNLSLVYLMFDTRIPDAERYRLLWEGLRSQKILVIVAFNNLLQLLVIALYILPFWFRKKTTPGKRLLRIEIVDATSYAPLTRRQAVLRFFGYMLSGLPLTLGFVWMLFNKKRQCWHDKLAHTIVVKMEKKDKKQDEKPA